MSVALRDLRHSRHLTLENLALLSGLSVAQLSRVETGKRHLSPAARIRIVRALELGLPDAKQVVELAPHRDEAARVPVMSSSQVLPRHLRPSSDTEAAT